MNTTIIPTTKIQQEQIHQLLATMPKGGSALGQVYSDGIRARILDAEQTQKLAEFLGELLNLPVSNQKSNSAFHGALQ